MARPGGGVMNRLRISGDVAYIDVSTLKHPNVEVEVDVVDVPLICDGRGRWRVFKAGRSRTLYVWRWTGPRRLREYTLLHRHLLGLTKGDGMMVDHVNRNGLDNRRTNLRLATPQQNAANVVRTRGIRKRNGRWHAHIRDDGRQRYLGSFETEREAEEAYDLAAREIRGEFVCEVYA
jgi:hypothetical protein